MYKEISTRVSFEKDRDRLEIKINQKIAPWKMALLGLWLLAWLACGIIFIWSSTQAEGGQQIILWIITFFWAFLFFRIARVFLWRRIGVEVIRFKEGKLFVNFQFGKAGKPQIMSLDNVKAINEVKLDERSYLQFMDNSFWSMGGERFTFSNMGREHQFGKQISDHEVRALKPLLNKAIREYKKKRWLTKAPIPHQHQTPRN